jgi:hypothetical protein
MLEHINAEISLGSIKSLQDLYQYFFNSFCYIRMKKSPNNYGVVGDVDQFVRQSCLNAIQRLGELNIIGFDEKGGRVWGRPLSLAISRNAV